MRTIASQRLPFLGSDDVAAYHYAGVIYSTEGYARSEGTGLLVVLALMAFAVWLVGRACRYVLAGT
jgi:hypothetical protein